MWWILGQVTKPNESPKLSQLGISAKTNGTQYVAKIFSMVLNLF